MSPRSKRVTALAAVLAAAVSVTGAAIAWAQPDMRLVVVNDNNRNLVQFYVNDRQVLGSAVGPGQAVMIDANDGRGCSAVLTAVFDDGSTKSARTNVCQVAQYPATARGIPYCPGDPRCNASDTY